MAARVPFRQGETCTCVAVSLPWVELDMGLRGLITSSIDIAQLGWRGDVDKSAGTHDEGGCTDTWGQYSPEHIDIWRLWGWTMQRRDLSGVNTHAHGWPWGCTHLAPAAQAQAADWARRDAGLQGSAQVVGRWPVKHWETALRENRMSILDDIEEAARRGTLAALRQDGTVPNESFLSGGGDTVSVISALAGTGRQLEKVYGEARVIRGDTDGTEGGIAIIRRETAAQILAVVTKVDGVSAQVDGVSAEVKALAANLSQ